MQLDSRGAPAVLIATHPFHSTLVATRKLSGIPDVRWAEVPHPLQSLDRAELRQRAELAVAQFVEIVVGR